MIKMIMIMNTASIVPMLASSSGERVSGVADIGVVLSQPTFSAVYLFYSRIIFKKLDDSARILFRKVEKTFKNATIN